MSSGSPPTGSSPAREPSPRAGDLEPAHGSAVTDPEGRREDPSPGKEVHLCDLCGAVMLDLHCKLVCERCGYIRDCSDP